MNSKKLTVQNFITVEYIGNLLNLEYMRNNANIMPNGNPLILQ